MTTEGTQIKNPEELEREKLVAEMLRDAQQAELSSELKENPVISDGAQTEGAPMVVQKMTDAGYYYIWDSRTYEKYPVLYYMLTSKLRVRRPDGSYRFTTDDPGKLPKRGTVKCMLHKDDPNRARYDELGFRVCIKDNITNQHQLKQHMSHKHPAEWAAIEDERKERERQEDRQLQRKLLEMQMPKEQVLEIKPTKVKYICDKCGKEFAYPKSLRTHKKECK